MPNPIPDMLLREALQEQYRAALAMLTQCVENCPDDLWTAGTHPRTFWRIAFHAAYYTHLYLGQNVEAYQPWPERPQDYPALWQEPGEVEPFELPEECMPYTKSQIWDYIAYIDSQIGPTVAALDLETPDSGFPGSKSIGKLSYELMNLRHTQGHVGQLSELLMAQGIDIDFIGKWPRSSPER